MAVQAPWNPRKYSEVAAIDEQNADMKINGRMSLRGVSMIAPLEVTSRVVGTVLDPPASVHIWTQMIITISC